MKKMYEKKNVLFYVFPYEKNNFSVFFHTKEQVINFINEMEWDDIN